MSERRGVDDEAFHFVLNDGELKSARLEPLRQNAPQMLEQKQRRLAA